MTVVPTTLPADLVPAWETPEDERLLWSTDPMHSPEPITVMQDDKSRLTYRVGMAGAFRTYGLPMRADARRFFTRHYSSISPLPLPPAEIDDALARAQGLLQDTLAHLWERWEGDWLPEIRRHLAVMELADLRAASDAELAAAFDDALERSGRLWQLHFEVVLPAYLAMSLFDELYRELLGAETAFDAYELLQGLPNMTVQADSALYELARSARSSCEVTAVLRRVPAEHVIEVLDATTEGRAFLTDLYAFLREYGHRSDSWGFHLPTWAEDARPVIARLKEAVQVLPRHPAAVQAELADHREARIAEARERLAAYPKAAREQFEQLLRAAQAGVRLSEDHGYWIDFRGEAALRRVVLEVAQRLAAAGVIEQPADILHLHFDEVRETLAQLPALDRRALVAERQAEIERYRNIEAPAAVGTPPQGEQPASPLGTAFGKFFGSPPRPSDDPDLLLGSPGSPGVTSGRVKVLRSLADAGKLKAGDVLVSETTAPPWTPLFARVAAVVTDTGGVLSHCAVVAREYAIPAVVGVGVATRQLRDGELIEVDGTRGTVRRIHEA